MNAISKLPGGPDEPHVLLSSDWYWYTWTPLYCTKCDSTALSYSRSCSSYVRVTHASLPCVWMAL